MTGVDSFYPLNCGQRWILHLFLQEPVMARPVQRLYRLPLSINTAALQGAFTRLQQQHDALRMRLIETGNEWRQQFSEEVSYIRGEEITGRTEAERLAYAMHLVREEAGQPLDLRTDAPVKALLIKVNETLLFSLCIDHMAADEYAFDKIEKELLNNYSKDLPGHASEISSGFKNYLLKESATAEKENSNLAYWEKKIGDFPSVDEGTYSIQWVPAAAIMQIIEGQTFERLLRYCQVQKITLFHLVVALQLRIMQAITGREDFILNIPVSNRTTPAEKDIIANLSMLLHIPFHINNGVTPGSLLIDIRDRVLESYTHRNFDYGKLSARLNSHKKNQTWLQGCNFIPDASPLSFPNILFEERLDNLPGRNYDLPLSCFTTSARQKKQQLEWLVEWDARTWAISQEAMTRLLEEQLSWLRVP